MTLALLLGFGLAGAAMAQGRVALVIGNGAYAGEARLANPPNDARRMAEMLRRDLGFEVLGPVLDGGMAAMDAAVDRFQQASQGAEIALFFYAGHGIEDYTAKTCWCRPTRSWRRSATRRARRSRWTRCCRR